ncbi:MAG: hypothetical protein HQL93_05025 [Magnetococcales bacterium]|nr:hypothetical protein [Magnetococcales bacterium]
MISIKNCQDLALVKAWNMHARAVKLQGLPPASAHILLFYAVECGLKYLLLEKRMVRTCPDKGLFHSHELANILRELSPSAAEVGRSPSDLHLILGSRKMRHPYLGDVHSAWRYGISIDQENEKEIVDWLLQVNSYIAKRMKRL